MRGTSLTLLLVVSLVGLLATPGGSIAGPPVPLGLSGSSGAPTARKAPATGTGSTDLAAKLRLTVRLEQDKLSAEVTNFSSGTVTFHFDPCGICFWTTSVDGGAWGQLLQAMHEAPCVHANETSLPPGQSIDRLLEWTPPSNANRVKVRYSYGPRDEPHLFLQSNELVLR
ncbi:MAG: hypothetical protein HY814_06785 [Candidatus Riflebacteria bacterium]|nr:hypothetical protein [Candidatus Riflebacteria bacterium]